MNRIFYHGTITSVIGNIVEAGALLSPLEVKIDLIRKRFPEFNEKELERMALAIAREKAGEYEEEHRLKCVSLTADLTLAAEHAPLSSGIILGLEYSDEWRDATMQKGIGNETTFYIPRRVDITPLKEVYLKSDNPLLVELIKDGTRLGKYPHAEFFLWNNGTRRKL